MTDITRIAQEMKSAAEKAKHAGEAPVMPFDTRISTLNEYQLTVCPDNVLAVVEALEKAKGMETYWKTQCRGITDHCEELQARIAELESHTVKPPVHPTVASEKLDDETLQELIEFRRTTFEYHSKEGNKVQTIIHGVTLAALRELQERRKADSEPVAEVVSIYGDPEAFGEREIRPLVGIQQMPYGTPLYRHAQQPVVPDEMLCDFYEVSNWPDLVRELVKHVEQLQDSAKRNVKPWEDTFPETLLPAYIERIKLADEACRAAVLQAGNSPVIGIDPASGPDRTVEVRYVAPPGYVMVPKEPTEAMINAWLSEVANWSGHVAGYEAMLAAAQQEVK